MKTQPIIEKYIDGENVSKLGAFSSDKALKFLLKVPRRLGSAAPILRIQNDGEEDADTVLDFVSTDGRYDTYKTELDFDKLTDGSDGLFYYTFVFPYGTGAYFTTPINNVDFELTDTDEGRFRLLVYKKGTTTPEWLKNGVMYQIFVDRFCRGKGKVEYREDSVIDNDWENGVPQYGEYPGAFVENNVFFGGNLWGVSEKLDYLSSLGVTVIYLNPIFEARSNHKYDTGDYLKIDKGFGGEEAFAELIKRAKEKGIRIILDGVFNHTGDDSRYFDRYGRYGEGAYSSEKSKYRKWYNWKDYPDEYECWWGIPILPRLNQDNPECRRFFTGKGGVAEKYIKEGISGWRIDVADELNDEFLDELNTAVKSVSQNEGAIIGEVWENASNKVSYGKRRRYLRGGQLDSVMNYPLRNGIIAFAKYRDAETLYNALTEIYASYPRHTCDCLMNIVGTHDTERILTVLGGEDSFGLTNDELAVKKMTRSEREQGKKLLKIASIIQYTVYGIPSLYYGDEAGVQGYHDPFCRLPFPWGKEDKVLFEHYKKLGELRREHKALDGGDFNVICHSEHFIAYERVRENDRLVIAANRGEATYMSLEGLWRDALTEEKYKDEILIKPDTAVILEKI